MKSNPIAYNLFLDDRATTSKQSAAKDSEDFRAMLDPAKFQETPSSAATAATGHTETFTQPSKPLTQSSTLINNAKGYIIYHNKRFYPLKGRSRDFHPMALHHGQNTAPATHSLHNRQPATTHPQKQPGELASTAKSLSSLLGKIKNWFGNLLFGDDSQQQQASNQQQTEAKSVASSLLGLYKNFGHLFAGNAETSNTDKTVQAAATAATPAKLSKTERRTTDSDEIFSGIRRQSLPTASASAALHDNRVTDRIHTVIKDASAKYGLPVKLVAAVVKVESGFNPHAVSPTGAKGLMQLMPATAQQLRVKNCFDIEQNVDAGCRYLRQLLDQFDGKVRLALAAYNAGSGAVREYGGIPPYHETRRYISRVLAYL